MITSEKDSYNNGLPLGNFTVDASRGESGIFGILVLPTEQNPHLVPLYSKAASLSLHKVTDIPEYMVVYSRGSLGRPGLNMVEGARLVVDSAGKISLVAKRLTRWNANSPPVATEPV